MSSGDEKPDCGGKESKARMGHGTAGVMIASIKAKKSYSQRERGKEGGGPGWRHQNDSEGRR